MRQFSAVEFNDSLSGTLSTIGSAMVSSPRGSGVGGGSAGSGFGGGGGGSW